LSYTPVGREKPPFAYLAAAGLRPRDGAAWRGRGESASVAPRPKLGGRDFSMWTGIGTDAKWWAAQKAPALTPADVSFQFSPPADFRAEFHKQYADARQAPLVNCPGLVPGLYLGESPDLSPGTPLRRWLEHTRTPFYVMTNYANPAYTDRTGPATY